MQHSPYSQTNLKTTYIEIFKGNFEKLPEQTLSEVRIYLSSTFKGLNAKSTLIKIS
jgi:hypothetical protein